MQDSCHQQFHLIFESWLLLGYFGGTWGMISGLVGFRSWKVWKVSFFHFLTKNHSQHFDPDSSSSSSSSSSAAAAAAAAVIILIIFFMYRYHAHIPPLSQHTNMKLQFSYVTNLPESLFSNTSYLPSLLHGFLLADLPRTTHRCYRPSQVKIITPENSRKYRLKYRPLGNGSKHIDPKQQWLVSIVTFWVPAWDVKSFAKWGWTTNTQVVSLPDFWTISSWDLKYYPPRD